MAAFMILFQRRRALRRERVFRDWSQALDVYTDDELISRYRFPRQSILEITDSVKGDIERPSFKGQAIPAHIQVIKTVSLIISYLILSYLQPLSNFVNV
jgi:hypothetical protein